jgi:pectinesterase inhibitor-like protein
MASIPRLSIFLILIILSLSTKQPPLQVNGDDNLIDQVCKKIPFPLWKICYKCINFNYPKGYYVDATGLAAISVNCSLNEAQRVSEIIFNFGLLHHNDSTIIDTCKKCTGLYNGAKRALTISLENVQGRRYKGAALLLMAADIFHTECVKFLSKINKPTTLIVALNTFQSYLDSATHVVDEFI